MGLRLRAALRAAREAPPLWYVIVLSGVVNWLRPHLGTLQSYLLLTN